MPAYPAVSTRVIGQTERSLGAILDRQLAGTGLTEPQWLILTLAVTSGGTLDRAQFTRQVSGALKIGDAEAAALIAAMLAAQQLEPASSGSGVAVSGVAVSAAARKLYNEIRSMIAEITERLWGDLPAEDLATAGRVLSIITERASAELAR